MKNKNTTNVTSLSDLLFGKGNQGGLHIKVTNKETIFSLARKQNSTSQDRSLSDFLFGTNSNGSLDFRMDSSNNFLINLFKSPNSTFLTATKDQK